MRTFSLLLLVLLPACIPTYSDPIRCTTDSECMKYAPGLRCDTNNQCTCPGTYYKGCSQATDAGASGLDGLADTTTAPDVSTPQCQTSATCPTSAPICTNGACVPCATSDQCVVLNDPNRVLCSSTGACVPIALDAAKDLPAVDIGADTRVPDAQGTCGTSTDCTDPAKGFCVVGACTGCTAPLCSARTDGKTTCATTGQCVECADGTQCTKDPAKGFCVLGACTGCSASICAARTDGKTVCSSTGTSAGHCVECETSATCPAATPICSATQTCTACTDSTQCAAKNPALPACRPDGQCVHCTDKTQCSSATPVCDTSTNKCVGCTASTQCSGTTPICSAAETCTACTASSQCAALGDATRAACATSTGSCVQCTDETTCSGATPICNTTTNTCRACTADSECAGIGPGVCMSHQDKRCASDAETIVVTTGGTLPSSVPSGKRLLVVRGSVSGMIAWTLSSPQMSIVGQSSGTITGTGSLATVHVTGGDLYIRGLSITGGSPGLWAESGAVVRLDHVSVSSNTAGGILLSGAGFDIKNTTVSNNGSNTAYSAVFGGIRFENSTSPKSLSLSTITGNGQIGVTCDSSTALSPTPTTVLVSGNTGGEVAACGFTSCGTASTTCGAQQ